MPILASGIALARLVGEAAAGRVTVVSAIPLGASGPSPDASLALLIRAAPFMTVRRSVSGWRDAPFATRPPGKSKTPTVVQDPYLSKSADVVRMLHDPVQLLGPLGPRIGTRNPEKALLFRAS